MSRPDAFMPIFIADYLGDTSHLSAAEHGGYLLLLMHYWRTGPLPNVGATLCRIARMTPDEWAIHGPTIAAFFTTDGEFLRHGRVDRERARATSRYESKRVNGKRGADARWRNHGEPDGETMANRCTTHNSQLTSKDQERAPLAPERAEPRPVTSTPAESTIRHQAPPDPVEPFSGQWPATADEACAWTHHGRTLLSRLRESWPDWSEQDLREQVRLALDWVRAASPRDRRQWHWPNGFSNRMQASWMVKAESTRLRLGTDRVRAARAGIPSAAAIAGGRGGSRPLLEGEGSDVP